ncbi:MAG: zinc ribbon domain-containing protein [Clostridia bacterium]|nr:zinc ribbon domain-containing protein [Clostridia bacterium]
MKYCTKCGRELQDDMQFCPGCGSAVETSVNEHEKAAPEEEKTVPVAEEPKPKKNKKGIIAIIIAIVVIVGGVIYINSENNTYNDFLDLYTTMIDGGGKTEAANKLIIDVWRNSISKTSDPKTDKFTRTNNGSGQFYTDFNDALGNLYDDKDFKADLDEILSLQTKAKQLMKGLVDHPKSYDEEYSDFKELYKLFVRFTDMPLACKGSLASFTEQHNELDNDSANKAMELNMYFVEEK